jgi:uncharacterized protein (DUF58 family)
MAEEIFDAGFIESLENLSLHFKTAANNVYSGGRRSKAHGSTVEFSDFREYSPGDDFRRIDWNAYARFEKFFVKLFLDEKQLHVRVFLDVSRSMDWGEPNKSVTARRLAAAFSYLAIRSLDRASILTIAEDVRELYTGVTGRTAFYQGLEKLSRLEFKGESQLAESVKSYHNIKPGDGVSVIISDFLTDSDYKSLIDYFLYYRQQVLVLHVLSPDELQPELFGRTRLMDSETKAFKDMEINMNTLSVYAETLRSFLAELEGFCASRGVYYIQVNSEESVESVLLKKGYKLGFIG